MTPEIARCSRGKCRRRPRENGRYCAICHAAANRRSHRKHRKERNARRRDRALRRTDEQRALDSARAKLYVAVARGKVEKTACVVCHRHDDVIALIKDPQNWMDPVWTCRAHKSGAGTAVQAPRLTGESGAWRAQRDAILIAICEMPKEKREALEEIAALGPAGIRIDTTAPLFKIRLVRAYQARYGQRI